MQLIAGDPRHGVVRYAGEVAEVTGCRVWREPGRAQTAPASRMHLHFTDRLWASDPLLAAQRVLALARRHPLTVTLHDLPQPSDGPRSHARRAECYRQVIAAARGVVCNSRWEAGLVTALSRDGAAERCGVIPLPVQMHAADENPPPLRREIGLLGFVYPGKGHEQAIDAAAALVAGGRSPIAVVALGAVSEGHTADAEALCAYARQRGVSFAITGWLSDGALLRRTRQALVPVAAHRHVSASGSIGSWVAAGRRPLVADCEYTREIDRLRPGTVRRYRPDRLPAAVIDALGDPSTTWLAPDAELRPDRGQVGAAYLDWWTREVAW